ncbi:unnamed protein product [Anisakis simplex]|uniref:CACTA en-spm transposon protein n=1 Tax=Anisakis simplex TaxID=6269 RepID=A0A0M3KBR1_ANISI|nr:unnamed protein product [Anisakis simplex]
MYLKTSNCRLELCEHNSRSKSGSLREFITDYDNIIGGQSQAQTQKPPQQRKEKFERNVESAYRSEQALEVARTRFGGSSDPVYWSRSVVPHSSNSTLMVISFTE